MLMMANHCYKHQDELGINIPSKYPFKTIYLHGLIRDKQNRKFSKSLGNGIDPIDMITEFSSDALRLCLVAKTGPNEDMRFNKQEMHAYQKFRTKCINSIKFMGTVPGNSSMMSVECNNICKMFDDYMDDYKIMEAARFIQQQYKDWFCNRAIEEYKKNRTQESADILYSDYNALIERVKVFMPSLSTTT